MSIGDMPGPVCEYSAKFGIDGFEIWIFDLVFTPELTYDEFRVHFEFYLRSSEFDRSANTMECSLCFGEVIRGYTERLVTSLDFFSIVISNIDSESGRSWIAASSSVSVDDEFHIDSYIVTRLQGYKEVEVFCHCERNAMKRSNL